MKKRKMYSLTRRLYSGTQALIPGFDSPVSALGMRKGGMAYAVEVSNGKGI